VVDPEAQLADGVAVGPLVSVAKGAKIGEGAVLCAGVRIGRRATVGPACVLRENVVVQADCVLGSRVRIGPGSVVGYDGFGYYYADGAHHHVPHTGNVVIEDDVDLGACACVDRAKFGSTRIGAGTKIDNLVQVAHNVQTGRGCLLAAQVGIAGSTQLGNFVVLGGHTGVRDNIAVGDGVQCAAYAAIAQDVPAGQTLAGIPAEQAGLTLRIYRAKTRLPDLIKRVRSLESRLKALESAEDH
jgi:UDP-3-O-[3-hydroxymyristoyl] glucosamine N-acyltransferase